MNWLLGRSKGILRALPAFPLALWISVFVLVPLLIMLVYSFLSYADYKVQPPFTAANYIAVLTESAYATLLLRTLLIAAIATLVCLVIATPFAYFLVRCASRRVALALLLLVTVPLWTNTVVRNFAWITILGESGPLSKLVQLLGGEPFGILYTFWAALLGTTYISLPYAVVVLYACFEKISPELEEAATDLGSGRLQAFRKVMLPLSSAGYQTAILFILVPALGLYVTPAMLGGMQGTMLATALVPILKQSLDLALGSTFALLLIAFMLAGLALFRSGLNVEGQYRGGVGSSVARRVDYRNRWLVVWVALTLGFVYWPLFGLVLDSFYLKPIGALSAEGFSLHWYREVLNNSDIVTSLKNSGLIGLGTVLVTTSVAAPAAYAVVRVRFPGRGVIPMLAVLPMIIPTILLGMATLVLLTTFRLPLGLWSIIIGHSTLALPFVFLTVLSQQYGFDRAMEEASLDLGATQLGTFRNIVLPLMVPALAGGALLALTMSFNDFIVAFLLSAGQTTLPLYIWGMARTDFTPAVNALGALLIGVAFAGVLLTQLRRSKRRLTAA